MNEPIDFSTWDRKTLEDLATNALQKIKDQHDLIQYLRQLIATESHDQAPTRKTD